MNKLKFYLSIAVVFFFRIAAIADPEGLCLAITDKHLIVGTHGVLLYNLENGLLEQKAKGISNEALMRGFAKSGNNLFACAHFDIYISKDNGLSWSSIKNNLPGSYFWNIYAFDSKLFVVTTDDGLFSSIDNGTTWKAVKFSKKERITCMTKIGNSILAGTEYQGVFRSIDNGESWTKSNSGLFQYTNKMFPKTYTLTSNKNIVFAGSEYGIYSSANEGVTWQKASAGIVYDVDNQLEIFSMIGIDNTLLLTTFITTYISPSNGEAWTPVEKDMTGIFLRSLTSNSTQVFAIAENGKLYKSGDKGNSWAEFGLSEEALAVKVKAEKARVFRDSVFSAKNDSIQDVNSQGINRFTCFTAGEGKIYAGTNGYGVFLTKDNGKSWISIRKGLPYSTNVTTLLKTANFLYTATLKGIYRTADDGGKWEKINSGLPSNTVCSNLLVTDGKLYAATNLGLYVSSVENINWVLVQNGISPGVPFTSLEMFGTTILAGSLNKIYLSKDAGVTWSGSSVLPEDVKIIGGMAVCGKSILLATTEGVYGSIDEGTTWVAKNKGFPYVFDATSISSKGQEVFVAHKNGVCFSSNSGESWKDTPLISMWGTDDVYFTGEAVIAFVQYEGLSISFDKGEKWEEVNNGFDVFSYSYYHRPAESKLPPGEHKFGVTLTPYGEQDVTLAFLNENFSGVAVNITITFECLGGTNSNTTKTDIVKRFWLDPLSIYSITIDGCDSKTVGWVISRWSVE